MIDHNKHMNNTHYFDFFLDIFGDEKIVESAQIEYIKQVYLGDNIDLYKHNDENYDEIYKQVVKAAKKVEPDFEVLSKWVRNSKRDW